MKTTIELPDRLLIEAKAVAAKRRTTLKAMIEHSLRRELLNEKYPPSEADGFTVNEHGFPTLKRTGDEVVTSERVYQMMEDLGI